MVCEKCKFLTIKMYVGEKKQKRLITPDVAQKQIYSLPKGKNEEEKQPLPKSISEVSKESKTSEPSLFDTTSRSMQAYNMKLANKNKIQ